MNDSIDCIGDETEGCMCAPCIRFRADFDAWVEDTRKRWHNPDCGPLCSEHGDPRDTSIDVVREMAVSRAI